MNTSRLRSIAFALILSALVCPGLVFALSLEEAKSKGLVGEDVTGYLGAVQQTPEVMQLIKDINSKRRAKYEQIAQQNGTPVAAVEALAAKKAIEKTPSGEFIKSASGQWVKK